MVQFENRVYYDKQQFFETRSGNFINKRGLIRGSDQIQISGKTLIQQKLIIRGDLAQISLGKYTLFLDGIVIKPSYKRVSGKLKFLPIEIGDYVFVDQNTIIEAVKIGSYTKIGKDCIIGKRSLISDNVIILDGTIVPPDTVIPSYSVYGGKPCVYIAELPQCCNIVQKQFCVAYYNGFTKRQKPKDPNKPSSSHISSSISASSSKLSGTSSRLGSTTTQSRFAATKKQKPQEKQEKTEKPKQIEKHQKQ